MGFRGARGSLCAEILRCYWYKELASFSHSQRASASVSFLCSSADSVWHSSSSCLAAWHHRPQHLLKPYTWFSLTVFTSLLCACMSLSACSETLRQFSACSLVDTPWNKSSRKCSSMGRSPCQAQVCTAEHPLGDAARLPTKTLSTRANDRSPLLYILMVLWLFLHGATTLPSFQVSSERHAYVAWKNGRSLIARKRAPSANGRLSAAHETTTGRLP